MQVMSKLFLIFVKIGAFNFGGGYAILPLIEKEIITNNGWLLSKDFIDIIALSQMTPGPISINSATFVGYRVSGFWGAVAGTVGVVFPAYFLVTFAARFIKKYRGTGAMDCAFLGLRPAVIGLIVSATISVGREAFVDVKSVLLAVVAAVLVFKTKLNPIMILIISGALGAMVYILV
jgi:chromate transporter